MDEVGSQTSLEQRQRQCKEAVFIGGLAGLQQAKKNPRLRHVPAFFWSRQRREAAAIGQALGCSPSLNHSASVVVRLELLPQFIL